MSVLCWRRWQPLLFLLGSLFAAIGLQAAPGVSEPVESRVVKPGFVKPESVKPESVKPESVKPEQVILASYQSIKQLADDNVLVAGMPEQQLLLLMEQQLGQVIDFNRVARKVMGKYARQSSDAHLAEFGKVFKQTLVKTYSRGLKGIDELETVEVSDALYDREGIRAKVATVIVLKGGQRYQVLYRMFLNDQQQWRVENLEVEGINIGLLFRNQFAHYMEQHNDVSKAIDNWGIVTAE